MRGLWLAVILALAAPAALAETRPKPRPAEGAMAIATDAPVLRPRARPAMPSVPEAAFGAAMAATPPPLASKAFPRPEPRPRGLAAAATPAAAAPARTIAAMSQTVPRPKQRPEGLEDLTEVVPAVAVRPKPVPETTQPKRGSVCGDRRIRGESLPPITGRIRGCGVEDPVRVTEVDGVRLSTPITVDCPTAVALKNWLKKGLKPAVGRVGVAELKIAASYSCRTRNNRPGAPISEHGKGKAVDISAVVLGNGKVIDVLTDYGTRAGKALRVAHKAACGIFATTLGPGSDGYHENHLHLDTAGRRSGAYCR
jgi:hypothetical protein